MSVLRLHNTVQPYAWGSTTAIAEFLGEPSPSDRPEAELWIGAHPVAPSRVQTPAGERTLTELIDARPEAMLGERVVNEHGAVLPFLLKLLAAARPLSLQAHPSAAQARAGFEAEERRGLARDAPDRNYRDPRPKPELIVALEPFEALCGFQAPDETRELLAALACPALDDLAAAIEHEDGLRQAFVTLMRGDADARARRVARVLPACEVLRQRGSPFTRKCEWVLALGRAYPGDIGSVSALLLDLVRLEPGQGMFLPAGKLHSYLHGFGVEVMASSDNVLRGGLTPKHVDVPELLRILDFDAVPAVPASTRWHGEHELEYETPAREFRLSRIEVSGPGFTADPEGPELLLCAGGTVEIADERLARGASVFVPASHGRYRLLGEGIVYRVTAPVLAGTVACSNEVAHGGTRQGGGPVTASPARGRDREVPP